MNCLSVRFLFCFLFKSRTCTFLSPDHIQLYVTPSADAEGPLLFHTSHTIPRDVALGGRTCGHTPELWRFGELLPQGNCWTCTAECPPDTAHPAHPQQDTAGAWMQVRAGMELSPVTTARSQQHHMDNPVFCGIVHHCFSCLRDRKWGCGSTTTLFLSQEHLCATAEPQRQGSWEVF